jgi:diguanylate cyclase (GGDEF)-like protein/PAS domain S-box-containing protein
MEFLPEERPFLLQVLAPGLEEAYGAKLREIQPSLFVAQDSGEALTVLRECEELGNPVGLAVLAAEEWSAELWDAVTAIRELQAENELPVFVVCQRWERSRLLDAVRAGVNLTFEEPVDWDLLALQARRKLGSSSRAWRLRSEKALAEEMLSQHRQANSARDLWALDLGTRQLRFADEGAELIGYPAAEIGKDLDDWLNLIHPLDLARLSMALAETDWADAPDELRFEFRLRHRSGAWCWILMRGRLECDEDGVPVALVGTHTDITQAKTTDPITGLANRFQFEDWFTIRQDSPQEPGESRNVSVFLAGIDRFAMLQDSLGVAASDRLLRMVAERLTGMRPDLLARLGGDEFALAVTGLKDEGEAREYAQRVSETLSRALWIQGRETFISPSVGYCQADRESEPAACWRNAEIALHAAKSAGGSRVVLFDASMRQRVLDRMELETDLKRAVELWEFEIYYQPKVTLQHNRITGFEALIRWRHPVKGIVPPSQFIPLAEENGLILPIGLRTVREACKMIQLWQAEFQDGAPLEVSVNLSVKQFQDPNLLDAVREILRETQIPPQTLQFEVTESVLVENPAHALELVKELRSMGIGLKIDDFGTGYSSLSYLHKLPFDTLKIDRSFISTMGQDHSAYEIVRAIIMLAENLGLQVVAEGVETRHQADQLKDMGCAYGQGYLFSPPLTSDAARRLLLEQACTLTSSGSAQRAVD